MADNTVLNTGSGGDTLRDLQDSGNVKWPVAVTCYATTLSPGANVMQVVTTSFGLPVAQQGSWAVTANVGTTGGLALDASVTGLQVAQGSSTPSQKGLLIQGAVTTAAPSYTTAQTSPFSLDTSGNVRTLSAQGGTWTVQPGNTANTTAWLVTGTGGTFPATQSGTWTVQPGNTPNTTPWLTNQSDPAATTGTITAQDAVVSSASGQGGQSILTGTPTASSSVSCTVSAETTIGLQVTGVFSATLVFERSIDGGTTYTPMGFLLHGVAGAALLSVTSPCILYANCGGSTTIRVRCTAFVSGTATIRFQAGFGEVLVPSDLTGINTVQNAVLKATPNYAKIALSTSGAGTVVAAVAGKQIVITRWSASANGAVNINWQSHTTTATQTGLHYMTQFSSAGGAFCPQGLFATVAGEALDLNLSASVAVGGELTYVLV